VIDKAGNVAFSNGFHTSEGKLEFLEVDVTDPAAPAVKIERSTFENGETPTYSVGYWDALTTFNGVQGVKIDLDVISNGDVIDPLTVEVNGNPMDVIDAGEDIYFARKADLNVPLNQITYEVTETSGNVKQFTTNLEYETEPTPGQYFEVVSSALTRGDNDDIYLKLDFYVTETALQEKGARGDQSEISGATSFDFQFSTTGNIPLASRELELVNNPSLASGNGVYRADLDAIKWSGYSRIGSDYSDFDNPLLTIHMDIDEANAGLEESAGTLEIDIAKINENAVGTLDTTPLEFQIEWSDLIVMSDNLI